MSTTTIVNDAKLVVRLPSGLEQKLRALALKRQTGYAELVRELLRQSVEQHAKDLKPKVAKSRSGYLPSGQPDPDDPDNLTWLHRDLKGWSRASLDKTIARWFLGWDESDISGYIGRNPELAATIVAEARRREAAGEPLYHGDWSSGEPHEPVTRENLPLYNKRMEVYDLDAVEKVGGLFPQDKARLERLREELERLEQEFE
jgi:hypothetical protein